MSEKRTKLQALAADAVQRAGMHNLSFRTLADQAGIKSSSVHYYFPEKADLTSALIEEHTSVFKQLLSNISQTHPTVIEQLDAFVDIFEAIIAENKFCLCGMLAAEVATLTNANQQLLKAYFDLAENWLSDVFSSQTSKKTTGLTPRQSAQIIISGLEGALLIDRVDGGSERLNAQRHLIHHLIS